MTRRNAGHRAAHAARYAAVSGDAERFALACAWVRASAALLARRRPRRGIPQRAHENAAARLLAMAAGEMRELAESIDRGDYDAK